jgi:hypothetical protein
MPGHDILIRNGLVFGSAGQSAFLDAIENSSAYQTPRHASQARNESYAAGIGSTQHGSVDAG